MRAHNMQIKQNSGFTMIELMIVLVIMGILAAIAVPSFGTLIKKNNIEAFQAKLSGAVGMARAEAASRNVTVSICKSNNQTSCVDAAIWSDGWIVFTNKNDDLIIDATDDEILDAYTNTRAGYTLTVSPDIAKLSFSSQGFVIGGADAVFTICEPDKDTKFARGLYISKSGLVMKTSDSNNNGIHNIPGALTTDLSCPAS